METEKARSRAQENLLQLYLRLNGFFLTGLIVHKDGPDGIRTEVDTLAVRHRFHCEPERVIEPSPFIGKAGQRTDLFICEVKSKGQSLQFNARLRDEPQCVATLIRWAGLFDPNSVNEIAEQVRKTLQTRPIASKCIPSTTTEEVRICGVICCPERWEGGRNDPWFLGGKEIFEYIWNCFRPDPPRPECATKYDFTAWGSEFECIVLWFKKKDMAKLPDNPMTALYEHLRI